MLQTFVHTSERYADYCNDEKYELSDFIRKTFQKEINYIEKRQNSEEFIYMKLCGDNDLLTKERLNDDHVKGLCAVLEEDTSVRSLDLRYNRITDKGAVFLAQLIKKNRIIVELNLMGNDIEEEGAKYIGDALMSNATLKTLKLTGNKIGDTGGMYIAQALQVNNTLEDLDIGECDLKIGSVIAFSTVLKCNTSLKSINLDRPLLWTQQEETTVHMENMLYINKTLLELHLTKYNMRDFGMERLCDALVLNTTLTILDLSCNRITRDGAKVMAKVLKRNTPLKVLDLGYNRIHDDGITAIAQSISYCNTNLKCLVITFNEIGEEGLMSVVSALQINSTLEHLFIWGNSFTSKVCKAFSSLFESFRILQSHTDVHPYVVDGCYDFALLPHNMDYRRFRFVAPIYGDDVPKNRSYAIM